MPDKTNPILKALQTAMRDTMKPTKLTPPNRVSGRMPPGVTIDKKSGQPYSPAPTKEQLDAFRAKVGKPATSMKRIMNDMGKPVEKALDGLKPVLPKKSISDRVSDIVDRLKANV